jgi:hypothetical protein
LASTGFEIGFQNALAKRIEVRSLPRWPANPECEPLEALFQSSALLPPAPGRRIFGRQTFETLADQTRQCCAPLGRDFSDFAPPRQNKKNSQNELNPSTEKYGEEPSVSNRRSSAFIGG